MNYVPLIEISECECVNARLDPLSTFSRPGKPVENAFIESCNGRLREERVNRHQFASLAAAQHIIEAWWLG